MAKAGHFLDRLSGRERKVLFLVLVLGIAGLLERVAIEPLLKEWKAIREEIVVRKAELEKLLAGKVEAEKLLEANRASLARGWVKVPKAERRSWFSDKLETIAKTSDVTIYSWDFEERGSKVHEELQVRMHIEGTWEGVARFLCGMQAANEIFDARELRNLRPKGPGGKNLEADLVVAALFLKGGGP